MAQSDLDAIGLSTDVMFRFIAERRYINLSVEENGFLTTHLSETAFVAQWVQENTGVDWSTADRLEVTRQLLRTGPDSGILKDLMTSDPSDPATALAVEIYKSVALSTTDDIIGQIASSPVLNFSSVIQSLDDAAISAFPGWSEETRTAFIRVLVLHEMLTTHTGSDNLLTNVEIHMTRVLDGGGCFAAGTLITLSDGTTIPIESIAPGDLILSYDAAGTLVPGRVTRTFRNEVSHLLDVHGLKVTPGHVTLCGDGMFAGRHVPIIDILLSDGALVKADGTLVRMAIDKPVGSVEDRFVKVLHALTAEDARSGRLREGEMRVGTLLFDRDGAPVSVLDCLHTEGLIFDPETGLVAKLGEAANPLHWFGALPRSEDYILRRSREMLEEVLVSLDLKRSSSKLISAVVSTIREIPTSEVYPHGPPSSVMEGLLNKLVSAALMRIYRAVLHYMGKNRKSTP